jgi:cellulose synthase/poly-beta-1,6-N-acetylglucosamine synthase-like glycosyltransferase
VALRDLGASESGHGGLPELAAGREHDTTAKLTRGLQRRGVLMATRILRARADRAGTPQIAVSGEYAFLVGKLTDAATIAKAEELARRWSCAPQRVLFAEGWVESDAYCRLLAGQLGLPLADDRSIVALATAQLDGAPTRPAAQAILAGIRHQVLDATAPPPSRLARLAAATWRPDLPIALASGEALEAARLRLDSRRMVHRAVWGLARASAGACAASGAKTSQAVLPAVLVGLLIGGLGMTPEPVLALSTALVALPFLAVVVLRLAAFLHLLLARPRAAAPSAPPPLSDAELPTYAVLVPLYRESHMLPRIVAALQRLDYPSPKLDIRLVLEAIDTETIAAAGAMELPGNVRIVVVPDRLPRTKPKALNFALALVEADLVAVYDAEDEPEPDQLRKAVEAFRSGPANLACVQARLNVRNRDAGFLARQFCLEYSAQFDGLLPCLDRLGLPIPLGGTSNHFRREALVAAGGWDAFNVTEDADLGIRLDRRGWRTGTISSTTWEEAPVRLGNWLRQRTRWLKGWLQTWLVHTRSHRALWRELGPTGYLAVHTLIGGVVLSSLLHPWCYVLIGAELIWGQVFGRPQSLMGTGFWHLAIANLTVGFLAAMGLGALAVRRRGFRGLAWRALLMPLYWLLTSVAAYRALWQLARDPFLWEKTEHGEGG